MSGTADARSSGALRGLRILVAEDEYFIADEIAEALADAGAEVAGPMATVAEALHAAQDEALDGAILDVNLSGRMVWPVVDVLAARGVPVVLATGYDAGVIPPAHAHLPRCEKPAEAHEVARALATSIAAAGERRARGQP
ncbi:response regulator [Roseomonas sp. CCTCC AB2023176]|uniref:response regulator n=1 Tax=Roseomonas sp. CCTCC AB2023176 TaxID=3342640 RepID=UPI0035D574EC